MLQVSACCFTSSALSSVIVAIVSSLQPKAARTSAWQIQRVSTSQKLQWPILLKSFWKGWIVDCKQLPTSDMMDRNTCTALNRSAIRPQVEADYAEISVANETRRKADNASRGCSTMCIQHRWNNRSWNAIHSVVLSALHSKASSCPRRNALPYGRHNKMGNKMIMKSTSRL